MRRPLQRTSPDTVPRAPEGAPEPGKLVSRHVELDGNRRKFVLYVPRSYSSATPVPLLLNLHGSTSYPEEQMLLSGLATEADRHGFAVLAPEALERAWNVPRDPNRPCDVRFIHEACQHAGSLLSLLEGTLLATGFSGGGRMLAPLAAELPVPLTAIAPVAGLRFATHCPVERRPAVIAFHGALDRVNPFDGGGFDYWQSGVVQAAHRWAQHLGADGTREESPAPQVTHTVFGHGLRRVELYRIENLGHIWPGFPVSMGEPFDPPSRAVRASRVMCEFFGTITGGTASPPRPDDGL